MPFAMTESIELSFSDSRAVLSLARTIFVSVGEDIDLGGSVLGDIPVHAVLGNLDADAVLCTLVCSCIEQLDTEEATLSSPFLFFSVYFFGT